MVSAKQTALLKIINVNKFKSNELFNLHFSLLPRYRGCHTNFLQVYYGERNSGVTLHRIDRGIDTGNIIDQIKFEINLNDTGFDNYIKLMKFSNKLFNKNFKKIINNKYREKKQILSNGKYYSRKSVNYRKLYKINFVKHSLKIHNKIRALIFPAFQYPVVNGLIVKKSIYKNKKIYLIEYSNNKF